jgi:hypothetical protein
MRTKSTVVDDGLYQCVMLGGEWHLTQEQASPPAVTMGGAYIICDSKWAIFKLGFERRLPTCAACKKIVDTDRSKA